MRKFVITVILFLGIAFVVLYFSQLQQILATLEQANPWYLALALLIQAAWFVTVGLTYRAIYRLLGLQEGRRHMTLLAVAANFVNIVTTSAGFGGMAMFISDGQRRGHPSGKVTVAGALYLLLDEAAFLCVLTLGTIVLARRNRLDAGDITASMILLGIACVLAFLLYLGYRSTDALGRTLARMARLVNFVVRPVLRREYLSEARAHQFAGDISEGLAALPEKPRSLIPPFLLSLLGKVLLMGVLTSAFLAFNVPFSAGTIIGGFSIGFLFLIVSPTPSGIGVVEGLMALALHSLRVRWGLAVLITLAYRGVTFWLPLGVGGLAFRLINNARTRSGIEVEMKQKIHSG
jgi:glycosyltransferase 2 family protein